ncbi:MAG: MATE family efflux transporter, partial [Comamonadaceae bacterium]
TGCAWATVVVYCAMAAVGLWLLRHQAHYRPYGLWRRPERIDWQQMRGFARLGVPAGLAVLVEVTSFTLMALFIARLGTTAAAAHQIAANLTAVGYMVPLSLGIATTTRVSFWLGAGEPAKARRVCRTGVLMTVAMALITSAAMAFWRDGIAALYSDNRSVATAAAALLLATAAYHLADAVQTVCVFILRSYRVTVAPLVIYCSLLWGGGLAGGFLLCYRGIGGVAPMNSPLAFWLAGGAALWLTAILFGALLWRTVRRSR